MADHRLEVSTAPPASVTAARHGLEGGEDPTIHGSLEVPLVLSDRSTHASGVMLLSADALSLPSFALALLGARCMCPRFREPSGDHGMARDARSNRPLRHGVPLHDAEKLWAGAFSEREYIIARPQFFSLF